MYENKRSKTKVENEKISEELKNIPDFYIEMKVNLDSFIPLIKFFGPSDTFKIWKNG